MKCEQQGFFVFLRATVQALLRKQVQEKSPTNNQNKQNQSFQSTIASKSSHVISSYILGSTLGQKE